MTTSIDTLADQGRSMIEAAEHFQTVRAGLPHLNPTSDVDTGSDGFALGVVWSRESWTTSNGLQIALEVNTSYTPDDLRPASSVYACMPEGDLTLADTLNLTGALRRMWEVAAEVDQAR